MTTLAAVLTARRLGHPDPAQVDGVLHDTWGHLAPTAQTVYTGHVLIAMSCFSGDGVVVLDYDLKAPDGSDLESSPWLHADITDFAYEQVKDRPNPGWGVWRWEGTFRRLKNGKSRWSGKLRPQRIVPRFGK